MSLKDIPQSTSALTHANRRRFLQALRSHLPADNVLQLSAQVQAYECDGLSAYTSRPLCVVLPESIVQVQRIVRLCKEYAVPIVPRGAGTGLSGGATPHPDGIVMGFGKMNRILDIDVDNRCAVVQPGVRNQEISVNARTHQLFFAPDPSSQIACSIGGNLAENAGGLHCLKYGLTVHNILGVKMVLSDGELITVGGKGIHPKGIDWLALFCGSEGMLGICCELTVKLLPVPDLERLMVAGFPTITAAAGCVNAIIETGFVPAALEMMDKFALTAAENFTRCGYPRDCEAILLCEVDGCAEETERQIEQLTEIAALNHASSITVSQSEEQRLQLWRGRKSAFPAIGQLSPDYYCMDGTIPRRHLATVLQRIADLSAHYSLRVANVFHAGDGNLHPLILYDASMDGELEKCEELGGEILKLCVDYGGTITGEHGVGVEKIGQMCYQFNSAEINSFHGIRAAIDNAALFNPGKAIPTLNRCAEFGAMHVHSSSDICPGIERF